MRRPFLVVVRGLRPLDGKEQPAPPIAVGNRQASFASSEYEDAYRAIEILSDWEVSHMLARANFPPNEERIRQWFHEHRREWADGGAYRFAILHQARMIGLVDIDDLTGGEGTLGYWLERSAWGRGFASEAATAVVRFAFEKVGLSKLRAAHAWDNEASSRVLGKLGFQLLDTIQRFSHSRREEIVQRRYILTSRAESR
jgi:[ribosomal protein S5]-alanine N-acetyltransferase